jgi:hypothetical protein
MSVVARIREVKNEFSSWKEIADKLGLAHKVALVRPENILEWRYSVLTSLLC